MAKCNVLMCVFVNKRLYKLVSTYHSLNTSEAFRFDLISCFFLLSVKTSSLRTAHAACPYFDCRGDERHHVVGGRSAELLVCHRAKKNLIQTGKKMADLRRVCAEPLPCRVNCTRKPSCPGKLFIFLCILIADSGGATTHWVVTEDGKIQQQV